MKADIHPDYRNVVFQDVTSDFKFLTRSTLAANAKETIKWEDGNDYPLVKIEVSSATHPFYTPQALRPGVSAGPPRQPWNIATATLGGRCRVQPPKLLMR